MSPFRRVVTVADLDLLNRAPWWRLEPVEMEGSVETLLEAWIDDSAPPSRRLARLGALLDAAPDTRVDDALVLLLLDEHVEGWELDARCMTCASWHRDDNIGRCARHAMERPGRQHAQPSCYEKDLGPGWFYPGKETASQTPQQRLAELLAEAAAIAAEMG